MVRVPARELGECSLQEVPYHHFVKQMAEYEITMMPSEKFAIIADDFTGAGDSAIHFPGTGRKIELLLQKTELRQQLRHSNAVSLSTESRFMDPAEAAARVNTTIELCRQAGFTRFYKKIDSTFRGNPGSEIESALDTTGLSAALICTAMPRLGRTCIDGCIYLNDRPLHKTEISKDPFNPISTSSVIQLLGQQTTLAAATISLQKIEAGETALAAHIGSLIRSGIRLIVADASTESHLLSLARQIDLASLLPVGAGGFAKAIAENSRPVELTNPPPLDLQPQGPILAVVGSLSPISGKQAEFACQSNRFIPFDIQPNYNRIDIEQKLEQFLTEISKNQPNILLRISAPSSTGKVSKKEGERVANLLGDAAAVICQGYGCKTVFSTGGSTSMGIARALGIRAVSLVREIMPGIVLGSCSAKNTELEWFISKAGGFGDQDILNTIAADCTSGRKGV